MTPEQSNKPETEITQNDFVNEAKRYEDGMSYIGIGMTSFELAKKYHAQQLEKHGELPSIEKINETAQGDMLYDNAVKELGQGAADDCLANWIESAICMRNKAILVLSSQAERYEAEIKGYTKEMKSIMKLRDAERIAREKSEERCARWEGKYVAEVETTDILKSELSAKKQEVEKLRLEIKKITNEKDLIETHCKLGHPQMRF